MIEERLTARVVLINERQEVLLVKFQNSESLDDQHPEILTYWVTPGGGLEADESYEEAAHREILEETGKSVEIGPCIWTRELQLKLGGRLRAIKERYYVAHCVGSDVDTSLHDGEGIASFKWWSLESLVSTKETILPPGFVQLLIPILRNDLPIHPIEIEHRSF